MDILGEQMCLGMSCGPVVTHLLFPDPRAPPPSKKGVATMVLGTGPGLGLAREKAFLSENQSIFEQSNMDQRFHPGQEIK